MEKIDILREDFSQTLAFIDKCDSHIFKIKNWAIITSSAVIAFAVSQNHDVLSLANIPLMFPFLYLHLMYKSFQDTAIDHSGDISERIDEHLQNPGAEDLLAGYSHSFGRKLWYPSVRRVSSILLKKDRRHILNFYLLLGLCSILGFVAADFVS